MIEALKENLLDIRKTLEKRLITRFIAGHSSAKSEARKRAREDVQKITVKELQESNSNYTQSFSVAAKGQWVKQSKKAFSKTLTKFEAL